MITARQTTEPADWPVNLAEVKKALQIFHDEDDAALAGHIPTATQHLERWLRRATIRRTFRGFLDAWPRDPRWSKGDHVSWRGGFQRFVELPFAPLVSVEAVTTYDDDDVATVMDPATYLVDTESEPGRIVLRNNACWPIACRAANAIQVDFTAGYGLGPTDVPRPLRRAISVLAGHFLKHPEAVVGEQSRATPEEIPFAVSALAELFRVWPSQIPDPDP